MKGCSVVKPIVITDARLISSTVPETDYAAYNAATNYTVGQRVIYLHQIWEGVQTPNMGNTPGSNALYWAVAGPTNRWAMFDTMINTQTVQASPLTVVIRPGYTDSVTLFGLEGAALDVTVRNGIDGPVVYTESRVLDASVITSLYEYFYEPFEPLTQTLLTGLPPYGNAYITATLTGPGVVKCGFLSAGMAYALGETEYGVTVETTDFSRKNTTLAGVTTLVPGAFSRRLSAQVQVDRMRFNKVVRVLETLRSTPCAWIATDVMGLDSLTVYGFYRSAPISVDNFAACRLSLDVEGLI